MSKLSTFVTAGLATGTCLLAGQAFVTPSQPPASSDSLSSLPAGATPVASISDHEMTGSSTMAVLGAAGALAVAASANRRVAGSRMLRRAEPVTVAAGVAAAKAAGAAKAAAAAKGAVKAGGAVVGSATTSTMVDAADENPGEFDPEVGGKKYMKWEVGTEQFKKGMAQKKARNTAEWERQTARNPDGNFGPGTPDAKVDMYDPFSTLADRFTEDSREMKGTNVGDFDPALMVGVTEPLGYFDPLGFCPKGDLDTFRQLRTAELKHGRVAMMGALGAVVQHYVKFPGFEKVPSGLSAVNEAPGSYGAIALFLVAGILETQVWTESKDKEPGNFGDPLGWSQVGVGYTDDMRNRELNNGRAAMFAVMGIIVAELLTGKDGIEQLGLP